MINEQVCKMRRIRSRRRNRSRKSRVTVGQNRDAVITFKVITSCDVFGRDPRMSIAAESSGPDAGNRCNGRLWRYRLRFRAQLAYCATVV